MSVKLKNSYCTSSGKPLINLGLSPLYKKNNLRANNEASQFLQIGLCIKWHLILISDRLMNHSCLKLINVCTQLIIAKQIYPARSKITYI